MPVVCKELSTGLAGLCKGCFFLTVHLHNKFLMETFLIENYRHLYFQHDFFKNVVFLFYFIKQLISSVTQLQS